MDATYTAQLIGILAGAIFFIDGWGPSDEKDKSFFSSKRFRGLSIIVSGSIITPILDKVYSTKTEQDSFFVHYLNGCVIGWFSVFLLGLLLYLIWKQTESRDKKRLGYKLGEMAFHILDFIYLGISENPHLKEKRDYDVRFLKMREQNELEDYQSTRETLKNSSTQFYRIGQNSSKGSADAENTPANAGKFETINLDPETNKVVEKYEQQVKNIKTENEYDFYDWYYKGVAEFGKKEFEKTIAYMKNAMDKNAGNKDDYASALLYTGASYDSLGLYQKSLEINNRIITDHASFKDIDLAYYNKAVSLKKLRNYDEALVAYKKAAALKPTDSINLAGLGNINLTIGDSIIATKPEEAQQYFHDALDALNKSLAINNQYALAWTDKGTTLNKLRQFTESNLAYENAIALDANYADNYYGKACNYAMLNDKPAAMAMLKKSFAMDATLKEYAKTDSDLDNLRNDPEFEKIIA